MFDRSFESKKTDEPLRPIQLIFLKNCDLIIAMSGDGAMLSYSRLYGSKGIPILGINLGKLGFLTDLAPAELATEVDGGI